MRLALRRLIFRPANFARPNFAATMPSGACAKNCWCCVRAKCCSPPRCRSSISRGTLTCARPRQLLRAWHRSRMRRWAETPLEDWVFAPDYAIPLVENHFGVLSLEGFGLANRSAAATAAGAILHYVRTTQRGSLDHVDRIGFYERQNCLVLDAVTVRNLELIEPLFSGAGDSATLFRCLDCTVTPMGKRLLRAWMLRPSIDARARSTSGWMPSKRWSADLVAREELRRSHGRHSRPGAPAEPRDPGDGQSARPAGAGGFACQAAERSRSAGALLCRAPADAACAMRRAWRTCASASCHRWKTSRRSR